MSGGGPINDRTEGIFQPQKTLRPVGRFVRFGIVGGIGVLVNIGFYAIFHDWLGVYYLLAGAIAIKLATLNNFVLDRAGPSKTDLMAAGAPISGACWHFTFPAGWWPWWRSFGRFTS